MTEAETPNEQERLARRAEAIWGNPFSPESMAEDAKLNGPEKAYKDTIRYRRMRDLEEEQS